MFCDFQNIFFFLFLILDDPEAKRSKEDDEIPTTSKAASESVQASSSQRKLDSFVVKTTQKEKIDLDRHVARFVFATNSPFRIVENSYFKKMMQAARPGYNPPNRQDIGGKLLDKEFSELQGKIANDLQKKNVCMALDGWSNIRNDPVIGVCVTDMEDGRTFLIDTIDTKERSHTAEYLLEISQNSIQKCQEKYKCSVTSLVTDNAANVTSMRRQLAQQGRGDVITYGCGAHILNLFAHDLEHGSEIKDKVKRVAKYFRNHHFPAGLYKNAGGKSLVLPSDVRWCSLCDCLEAYLDNWHILAKICSDHHAAIEAAVRRIVQDDHFKQSVSVYAAKLKKVSLALDKVQADMCGLGEAFSIFQKLSSEPDFSREELRKLKERINLAITPPHTLAYLLHPKFHAEKMSEEWEEMAMTFASDEHPEVLPDLIKYKAKQFPFKEYLFREQVVNSTSPLAWWKALEGNLHPSTVKLANQLHSAAASSAAIERLFSQFGLVHTEVRNRLGVDKAGKLVALLKYFNKDVK